MSEEALKVERQTDVPPSSITSRPPFDPMQYAAEVLGEDRFLHDDLVLRPRPDVSWSAAGLDFDELTVMQNVDGVASVLMLESFIIDMPKEQVRSILFLLLSRGVLVVSEPSRLSLGVPPNSGFFGRG